MFHAKDLARHRGFYVCALRPTVIVRYNASTSTSAALRVRDEA
jgi:acetolactate synthase regulatory subunit